MTISALFLLASGAALVVGVWSLWRIAKNLDRSVDLLQKLLDKQEQRSDPVEG